MRFRFAFLLVVLAATPVAAHGTADNHLQIMVVDDRVKMNMVVDMRVLSLADLNGDGFASLDELASKSDELREWVQQSFKVTDGQGDPGSLVFADLTSDLNIASENGDRVDHARILRTVAFPESITELHMDLERLALVIPELRVTVIDATTGMRYRMRDPGVAQTIRLPAG